MSATERATLSAAELRESGLLHEINRLLLHPVGLALYVDPAQDTIGVYDDRQDPEGWYYHEDTLSPEKATAVAELIEQRGPARFEALGYVVQPLSPDVKQLKVSVLEPTATYIGAPDELDEGEELERTLVEQVESD
jgi:hypothetical protein